MDARCLFIQLKAAPTSLEVIKVYFCACDESKEHQNNFTIRPKLSLCLIGHVQWVHRPVRTNLCSHFRRGLKVHLKFILGESYWPFNSIIYDCVDADTLVSLDFWLFSLLLRTDKIINGYANYIILFGYFDGTKILTSPIKNVIDRKVRLMFSNYCFSTPASHKFCRWMAEKKSRVKRLWEGSSHWFTTNTNMWTVGDRVNERLMM